MLESWKTLKELFIVVWVLKDLHFKQDFTIRGLVLYKDDVLNDSFTLIYGYDLIRTPRFRNYKPFVQHTPHWLIFQLKRASALLFFLLIRVRVFFITVLI